jgi:hypothetical protein
LMSAALAQQKSAKDLIAGTWTLLIADMSAATAPECLASALFTAFWTADFLLLERHDGRQHHSFACTAIDEDLRLT